ncbi:recombinase family protein [Yinghuangia sp. YIM S09857]|uniref:recombinase family protein n=1 Tax=Yinghuangia sp. YIM S09857 TaxID=3436929 RepID=UPI003F53C6DB
MIDMTHAMPPVVVAAYLRTYPRDTASMSAHQYAVARHARELGLGNPEFYTDHGVPSRGGKPGLKRLMAAVEDHRVDAVLVPGPFVFSIDDADAAAIVDRIQMHGCAVLEVPPLRAHGPQTGRAPIRDPYCAPAAPRLSVAQGGHTVRGS